MVEDTGRIESVILSSEESDGFLGLWLDYGDSNDVGTQTAQRFDLENAPVGERFVTGTVDYFTRRQSLTMAPSGEFVVSWTYGYDDPCPPNHGPDCDFFAAYARKFDRDGSPITNPVRITDGDQGSTDRSNEGTEPVSAMRADGGFLVAWRDDLGESIRARSYDTDLTPESPYVVVGEHPGIGPFGVSPPHIAYRPGGGYTIVWKALPADTETLAEFWLRHIDSAGQPAGDATLVGNGHRSASKPARVAYADDGRGLVVWLDADPDAVTHANSDRIQSRAIRADGSLAPNIRGAALDEDGLQSLDLVALRNDDSFAVAWRARDTATLEARRLTLDGEPVGDISTLRAFSPDPPLNLPAWDLEAGTNGELIVAWEQADEATLLTQRFGSPCGGEILCLGADDRFRVQVNWRVDNGGEGRGNVRDQQTLDTGSFWFFNADNVELVVKVLDGRPINGHFWVFYGSLSNVAFDLKITDTVTGRRALYQNNSGTQASRGDTQALPSD